MIVNWLKTLFKKETTYTIKNEAELDITNLFDFLWSEIDVPKNASLVKSKYKTFNKLPVEKRLEALPELYLIFEEYLISKNVIQKYSKQRLRQTVFEDFPFISNYPNLALIFLDLKEQELNLCKLFLSRIIENASNLIGEYKNPEILKIKEQLARLGKTKESNTISQRKKLLEYSSTIFSKIKNSFGEDTITDIYLIEYEKYFKSYQSLESFTTILNVIPEEIFSKDLINFPSKQQMLKMLQKQLYNLEEVNEQLTTEVKDRKKIQNELKHSEYLKSRMLQTAMDGIILVDQQGIVLDWNQQAENTLKIKKEETVGFSIFPLLPHKLRGEIKSSINEYIEKGEAPLINKRVETSIYLKDGTIVHIELNIVSIRTGKQYLFNTFFRDITNKKKVDNEIRDAKVFAERSAEAKSTFLSNMSHEIRTPLNVILGLTGILQKSDFSSIETDKKNLDGIQFSAENLLVLINDILDFSKIEAGKLTLHKTDFNIHQLINNVSRGFKIKADEKGLDYVLKIDKSIPKFIIGDQFRLNQILINLIGNAIKFTSKGTIEIDITSTSKKTGHLTINFSVKDTGIGIPEDKLKNIFKSFYQVHEPGKQKIEGTGLGLSISKQLIELQGGKLMTESSLGNGSNFSFSIQYKTSKLTSSEHIIDSQERSKISESISGMTVLVVEDNKMNQFFIKQLFANWNIKADIADNGKIGVEKAQENHYDLILMDMHMPVMDGPEATINIRKLKDKKISSIPIIACSADVFPESKKRAIESGMDFYITKPISEEALEEIIYSLKSEISTKNTKEKNNSKDHIPEELMIEEHIVEENTIKEISTEENISKTTSIKVEIEELVIDQPIITEEKECDFSSLKQIFGDENDVIKSILEIFLEETPTDYKKLQVAIQESDFINSKQLAHKLKSSFKTLGLETQTVLLQEIEQQSKDATTNTSITELINTLDNTFDKVLLEINQEITKLTT